MMMIMRGENKKHWVFVSCFKRYTKIKRAVVPKERRGDGQIGTGTLTYETFYARLVSSPMHRQDFPGQKAPATPGTARKGGRKREREHRCAHYSPNNILCEKNRTKKTAAARPQGNRTTTPPLRDRHSARERCAKCGVGKGHDFERGNHTVYLGHIRQTGLRSVELQADTGLTRGHSPLKR